MLVSQCSAPHVFTTLPSPPSAAKAPVVVARERKSIKVRSTLVAWQ